MTNVERLRFKRALETKRQEIAQQIRAQSAELTIREAEHDSVDVVQSMNHRDEAVTVLTRLSRALADVDGSLLAMSGGCYGVCDDCRQQIGLRRLEIIPWASRCVRCQELVECSESSQPLRHVA
jgi:RNA polymerase-binding protein DksA